MVYSPRLGTDGTDKLITLLGDMQAIRTISRRMSGVNRMHAYQGVLLGFAGCLALVAWGHGFRDPAAVAGLSLVAAIAERGRVRLGNGIEASISVLPTVFAAAILGPLPAVVVAIASFAGDFPRLLPTVRRDQARVRGNPYLKWGIYTCNRAIYAAAAGLAALAVPPIGHQQTARLVAATVVAAVVAETL